MSPLGRKTKWSRSAHSKHSGLSFSIFKKFPFHNSTPHSEHLESRRMEKITMSFPLLGVSTSLGFMVLIAQFHLHLKSSGCRPHFAWKKAPSPDFAYPHGIIFTPDGRRALVTSEQSRKIIVIDVGADQVLRSIDTDQGGVHMAVINKAGTSAYFANRDSNTVSFMDLRDLRIVANVPVGEGAEGIALSPNEREIWVGDRDVATVSIVDVATRRRVTTVPAGPSPVRVAFTPDGEFVLVPDRQANDLRIYDAATRALHKTISLCQGPGGIVIPPDGKTIYTRQSSNNVNVIDAANCSVTRTIEMGRGPDGLAIR